MTLEPKGDHRYRTHKSIKLWVVCGIGPNGSRLFGVHHHIQRVIYLSTNKSQFVQYDNQFYPVHSEEEFLQYIKLALKDKICFYFNPSMEVSTLDKKSLSKIKISSFIFEHEAGSKHLLELPHL